LGGYAIDDPVGAPSRENLLPALESALLAARDDGAFWMRRLDRILDWWLRREAVAIEVVDSDAFRVVLRVRNDADTAVEGVSLWLRPAAAEAAWRSFVEGAERPRLARPHGLGAPQPFEVLVLPALAAGAEARVELRVDRPGPLFADGFEAVTGE